MVQVYIGCLLRVYRALSSVYRALLSVHRALLSFWGALLIIDLNHRLLSLGVMRFPAESVGMYTFICMYVYIYIHTYMCIYIYICMYVHMLKYAVDAQEQQFLHFV